MNNNIVRLKKCMVVIFICTIAFHCEAQKTCQALAEKFQFFFNEEQSDSIFTMYAPVLKEQLPPEKNRTVFTGLHIRFGELRTLKLIKEDTGYARYKAVFKDQTLTLVIAFTKEDLIEGLRFVPYTPEQPDSGRANTKSNIFLKTVRGSIYGTLTIPKGEHKYPVVLIIAGSGPTDRNGNQGTTVITNAYKMLSDSLMSRGIATLRYDKRGVGESASAIGPESDLRFEDGVKDAVGFVEMLKTDKRFSKLFILGHSEGSLIGMIAAPLAHADGFISVAGAGERIDKIIEKQLDVQSPALAAKAKILFDSLNNGLAVDPGADLQMIFRPSVQPYIRSWMKYDPQQEIKKLKMPVLIIQGTTDMQVSEADANWLKAADPGAKLILINGMNHVLKRSVITREENASTYTNPGLPLLTAFVSAIANFVQGQSRL